MTTVPSRICGARDREGLVSGDRLSRLTSGQQGRRLRALASVALDREGDENYSRRRGEQQNGLETEARGHWRCSRRLVPSDRRGGPNRTRRCSESTHGVPRGRDGALRALFRFVHRRPHFVLPDSARSSERARLRAGMLLALPTDRSTRTAHFRAQELVVDVSTPAGVDSEPTRVSACFTHGSRGRQDLRVRRRSQAQLPSPCRYGTPWSSRTSPRGSSQK